MLSHFRFLDSFEIIIKLSTMSLQTSIEFEKESDVLPALEEILNCCNAFHTRGILSIYPIKSKVPIYRIPSGITSLPQLNEWMFNNHRQKFYERNGTIAIDEKRIVMNTSHMCTDGNYILNLIDHLSRPNEHWEMPPIPQSAAHTYKEKIKLHPETAILCLGDPNISRVFPKQKPSKKNVFYGNHHIICPISEIKNYSAHDDKVHQISENQWTSIALSAAAFNHFSFDRTKFSISTVYDLKRLLSENERNNKALQNYVASLPATAHPTPKTTVRELGNLMRKDFIRGINEKDYFSHMKSLDDFIFRRWRRPTLPGLGFEYSSMGILKIQPPIKDAHVTLMCEPAMGCGQLSFLSFTKENVVKKTKEFIGELQFNSMDITPEESLIISKSIEYSMKKLKDSTTVEDAIEELYHFQNSLRK